MYVCLLFASSLCVLFAVTVITTSYFSVGFSFPVFCVFSLFLCNKEKEESEIHSTRFFVEIQREHCPYHM